MLNRILLVVAYCWLSLLVSFSSKSYEQQYYVGDIGPNGGTVTSVTLGSVLSNSTTELVGDFEETTYTYVYTETVTEDVQTTNQVTTTTYETVEETTGDIITNSNLNGGTVTCTTQGSDIYYDPGGCSTHTINWDDAHIATDGGYQYQTDLDNFLTKDEINYGCDVNASNSVYASTNTATFSITLKVVDPTTGADTQTSYSWLLSQGTNNLSLGLTVGENNYSSDSILYSTFYGTDTNGYYWSMDAYNFNVSIDYYAITEVISTIEQIVTNQIQTSLTTTEYEYDSVYIPPVDAFIYEVDTVDILADFTIEIQTFDEMITMDFEIMETDTGEMQMEITTFENDMEVDVEIVDIDMESMVEEMDAPVEIEVAENESDSEPAQESDVEEEDKEEQKDSQSSSVKEKLAQKIVERVVAQGDQVAINNVKLAVMAQLTDTEAFAQYEAKAIQDNNFETFLQEPLEDPYAKLYDMGNDYLMEEMINQQWLLN
jgi:hypothetical protein